MAKGKAALPVIIIAVLILAGFFWMTQFASANRDRAINRSPIGVSALAGWLSQNDIPARLSHRRVYPPLADLGLRVMPLYDLDLSETAPTPSGQKDRLESGDLRDLSEENYLTKIAELPTLVLLPKWRGVAAELEILHAQALIPLDKLQTLKEQIGLGEVLIERGGAEFKRVQSDDGALALFHAQRFVTSTLPDQCGPVLTDGDTALIIRCAPTRDALPYPVWFLSDPDLLNNHGLGVADNAAFAVTQLTQLRGDTDKPIYVDVNSELLTLLEDQDEGQSYERGGEELSRFLQYPFSVFWAMFFVVIAVCYWRGAFRFGPVASANETGWDQSKGAAIAAKSRLLRLSGNDGAIVADFVSEQLRTLSTDFLGHDQPDDGGKRFFQVLARRDPALADALGQTAQKLMNDASSLAPLEVNRLLSDYHSMLKKVIDPHGSD